MKNSKIANLNTDLKGLFKKWLEITKCFHNLTNQQQGVLSLLLYHHYINKKEITNEKILWKIVFDYDTKALVKEELGIKDQVFQNILSKLRKDNIIVNNKISSFFIPNLEKKANSFKIVFNFNIIDG